MSYSLVIVESPTKAKTIGKYLGEGYKVVASIGHIRDLPDRADQIPEEYRDFEWSRLGVNVDEGFKPLYIIQAEKQAHVTELQKLSNGATDIYLATDDDREGEAISWHLNEVLKPTVPVHRLVFHEITKEAISKAIAKPRKINTDLVHAQEARRILDRLYGYEVSPLLWPIISYGLSAGRVQSVAVRLIVERERERMKFVSSSYWDLIAEFDAQKSAGFVADLVSVDGRNIPVGSDFDSTTGKIKNPLRLVLDEDAAQRLSKKLQTAKFKVETLEDKAYTEKPKPPFTTSTLQQEADRKLGYTAKRTMRVAKQLYQNGHITYMRTDSTNLASVAVEATRDLIRSEYGAEYLPDQPRTYPTKQSNAQEAHEAIRPAIVLEGNAFAFPESLRGKLNDEQFKLYDMIWKRTVACQMANSHGRRITVTIGGDGAVFQTSGKTIQFAGHLRAYVEGADDPLAELADQEKILPPLAVGEAVELKNLEANRHITKPPVRFSEAALTKKLDELGIGRPSTYASIIDTILDHEYVIKRGKALVPTWTAFAVMQLLETHLGKLVDYDYTAKMETALDLISGVKVKVEEDLDATSNSETKKINFLSNFYYGNEGLQSQLKIIQAKIKALADAREIKRIPIGQPAGEEPIYVRVGKHGPFLEQGERRSEIPEQLTPDEITVLKALELLAQATSAQKPIGYDPKGKPIYLKNGRYGWYIQLGENDDIEKNTASLNGLTPNEITVPIALEIVAQAAVAKEPIGDDPTTGKPIYLKNGPHGWYIQLGENDAEERKRASLLMGMMPEQINLETALKLLSLPRVLGTHPDDNQPVTVFNGRSGPYIKWENEKRSLPAELSPLDVTFEQAIVLFNQS